MALFVADQPFDMDAWSDDFDLFALGLTAEDFVLDEGFLGEDGFFYDDVYVREAESFQSVLELVIAGDFYAVSDVVLLGDAGYVAVYEDDFLVFYISDFDADYEDILETFTTSGHGGTHQGLLDLFAGDDDFVLTDGDDLVETGSGDDFVVTGDGDNQVYADDGNDTVQVGDDADFVSGGDGYDSVLFEFSRDDYDVEWFDREIHVVDRFNPSSDDLLVDVERVEFSDGALLFDIDSDSLSFAYRIYAAAYGRTPDEAGLRFWVEQLENRGSGLPDFDDKAFVASFFLSADEFIDLYGANPTNQQYIAALYQNVLGRQPDQAGYDFWLDQIASGQGKDDLLIYFADSEENISNVAPDIDDGVWVI
jgi:Ca2+-binding RTX toxin-like protein